MSPRAMPSSMIPAMSTGMKSSSEVSTATAAMPMRASFL